MFAMTSLAFMLVEVPAPPCMTPTTNWSWKRPSMMSWQAWSMSSALRGSSTPISRLARAAACFTLASATMRSG